MSGALQKVVSNSEMLEPLGGDCRVLDPLNVVAAGCLGASGHK